MDAIGKSAVEVLRSWGIIPAKTKPLNGGIRNDNWLVLSSGHKYVLRKVNSKTSYQNLAFELEYLIKLKQAGFGYKIPLPIENKEHKLVVASKGQTFWLYDYMEGKPITLLHSYKMKEAARMMARYHDILAGHTFGKSAPPLKSTSTQKMTFASMKSTLTRLHGKRRMDAFDELFLKNYDGIYEALNSIRGLDAKRLKSYNVHGDLHTKNIIWNKNKLAGIIDFEHVSSSYAPFVKELALMTMGRIHIGKNSYWNGSGIHAFIVEYLSNRYMPAKELLLLPDYVLLRRVYRFTSGYAACKENSHRVTKSDIASMASAVLWSFDNLTKLRRIVEDAVAESV